jgi:hypothetical protein
MNNTPDQGIRWITKISQDGTMERLTEEIIPPKKRIDIVVNPGYLQYIAEMGNQEATNALEVILTLNAQKGDSLEVQEIELSGRTAARSDNLLHEASLHLPTPSPDLQIEICGVNTDFSNILLLLALKRAKYRAKFNKRASCAGRTEPPQTIIHDILDEFPDFFD